MWSLTKLVTGAVFMVLFLCGLAGAQETHITMKNGATFDGLVVRESPTWIDIQIGNGRLRLQKHRIRKRKDSNPGGEIGSAGGSGVRPPTSPLKALGLKPGSEPGGITGMNKGVPLGLPVPSQPLATSVGAKAGNSATSLRDAPLPRGTPEHAVASFLRLVAAGHVQAGISRWVNVDHVLDEFFPAHAPSLTRYSRKLASQSWARILRMVFSDPKFMAAMRIEGIQVRTVRETGDRSLVEVSIPLDASREEVETYLLGVSNNRIVEFGQMLWSLQKVCEEMSAELSGAGSWILVPLLDKTADRILEVRSQHPSAAFTVPIPSVNDLREFQPKPKSAPGSEVVRKHARYRLVVPPTWKRMKRTNLPKFADMMVQSRSRKAFAMVLVEPSEVTLSALERAARANLNQVSDKVHVTSRHLVTTPQGEAVRFTAEASILGIPLLYNYHLIATKEFSYQLICWCNKSESDRFESVLDQIVNSFEVMPQGPSGGAQIEKGGQQAAGGSGRAISMPGGPGQGQRRRPSAVEKAQGRSLQVTNSEATSARSLKDKILELLQGATSRPSRSAHAGN